MFNDNLKEIIGDYDAFLDKVFEALDFAKIDRLELNELDHIAYRVEKLSDYKNLKKLLITVSGLHSEAEIRDRNISLFRLNDPIIEKGFIINYLELPAPSSYSTYQNGLEHAEFVLNDSLERFYEKHKDLNWNTEGKDRNENSELLLQFDGFSVRFHEKSLVDIRDERSKHN